MPYLDSPDFSPSAGNELICHVCGNHCDKGNKRGGMDISMGALITGILGPGSARSMHRVIVITIILQATGGEKGEEG